MNVNKIVEIQSNNKIMTDAFHDFISRVFPGISFKIWHKMGFWTGNYRPFSIVEQNKIIANASATVINIFQNGTRCKAIQIGAVGTLPEHRNQGLSRTLMNHIINKFKDEVELFFLHANETVLEYYPKFGFRGIKEILYVAKSHIPDSKYCAKKLNLDKEDDYSILKSLISNRAVITKIFGAEDYETVTMWHIINLYRDNLFYLEEENVMVIKQEDQDKLDIIDVIFIEPFDFQSIIPKIIESASIKFIRYYFPPDQLNFNYDQSDADNSGLFIRGNFNLAEASFRFPATAVT